MSARGTAITQRQPYLRKRRSMLPRNAIAILRRSRSRVSGRQNDFTQTQAGGGIVISMKIHQGSFHLMWERLIHYWVNPMRKLPPLVAANTKVRAGEGQEN